MTTFSLLVLAVAMFSAVSVWHCSLWNTSQIDVWAVGSKGPCIYDKVPFWEPPSACHPALALALRLSICAGL